MGPSFASTGKVQARMVRTLLLSAGSARSARRRVSLTGALAMAVLAVGVSGAGVVAAVRQSRCSTRGRQPATGSALAAPDQPGLHSPVSMTPTAPDHQIGGPATAAHFSFSRTATVQLL